MLGNSWFKHSGVFCFPGFCTISRKRRRWEVQTASWCLLLQQLQFCMSASEYSSCNFETRTGRSLLETGIIKFISFSPKRKRCQPLASWPYAPRPGESAAVLRSSHLWVSPQFEGSSLLCSVSSIFHPPRRARFTSRTNRGKRNALYFRLPGLTSETFSRTTAPLICISS